MKMTEREIAIYKLSEAAKTIEGVLSIREFYEKLPKETNDNPEFLWRLLGDHLKAHNIVIRKPIERPESLDDLGGMEILSRAKYRSCHDALCAKPHCTEDGKCGHKKHDGHRCKCPVCGVEYISSADGEEHNLDGECKANSGEE